MRKTKIVATIGPSSRSQVVLGKLVDAGLNVARFNLSHGGWAVQRETVAAVRQAGEAGGLPLAIMLDTRGPEVRLGTFPEDEVRLALGASFVLERAVGGEATGDSERGYFKFAGNLEFIHIGGQIIVGDGETVLRVETTTQDSVRCRVTVGGKIGSGKKLTFTGVVLPLPPLTPEDEADISLAEAEGADWIALSFCRGPGDILAARRLAGGIGIMAKIESWQGVENLEAILDAADGVMVARGDLGLDYPPEEVPILQKRIIKEANRRGKPVVTATQMLGSMVDSPRPTRAEASDIANAILDGTDAVMLSEETAVGAFPVEAVAFMASLAETVERAFPSCHAGELSIGDCTEAISEASCAVAAAVGAGAIVAATSSGHAARMVAKHRPRAPIIAITPSQAVARRLSLVWGVHPWVTGDLTSTDQVISTAGAAALASGLVRPGDTIVVTAGVPVGVPGTTNMIKVHTVEA